MHEITATYCYRDELSNVHMAPEAIFNVVCFTVGGHFSSDKFFNITHCM